MIEPNFNNMMWILLISMAIRGIASIVAGCAQVEKKNIYRYGGLDVISGIITLIVVTYILLA